MFSLHAGQLSKKTGSQEALLGLARAGEMNWVFGCGWLTKDDKFWAAGTGSVNGVAPPYEKSGSLKSSR